MIIESIIKKYGVSLDDLITDPNKTTLPEAMWRLYEYSNVLASVPLKDVVREVAVYLFTYKYDGNGLLEFQNFLNETFPVSLNWKELVDNTKSFRKKGEIIDILSAKCSGIKNMSSSFEDESTTRFDWLDCDYRNPESPDYNTLLRKVVFYDDV